MNLYSIIEATDEDCLFTVSHIYGDLMVDPDLIGHARCSQ